MRERGKSWVPSQRKGRAGSDCPYLPFPPAAIQICRAGPVGGGPRTVAVAAAAGTGVPPRQVLVRLYIGWRAWIQAKVPWVAQPTTGKR